MKLVQAVRAKPKSKILRVQSDFTTMLLGFRSCGRSNTIYRNIDIEIYFPTSGIFNCEWRDIRMNP